MLAGALALTGVGQGGGGGGGQPQEGGEAFNPPTNEQVQQAFTAAADAIVHNNPLPFPPDPVPGSVLQTRYPTRVAHHFWGEGVS